MKSKNWILCAATSMLALQAGVAMAQATPDGVTNQSDVEEIVVTANRREQRLSDVGQSQRSALKRSSSGT